MSLLCLCILLANQEALIELQKNEPAALRQPATTASLKAAAAAAANSNAFY